jgi:hypothetical protein
MATSTARSRSVMVSSSPERREREPGLLPIPELGADFGIENLFYFLRE